MAAWRPWSAAATVLGLVLASQVALPDAAMACSCAMTPKVETPASMEGRSMAIVTRLDDGGPRADFAIEATWGAEMPNRVSGDMDDAGNQCRPWVDPRGGVGAVVFNRELLAWNTEMCGSPSQEEVFLRALGNPVPIAGGQAVAVASGRFGGSNLVAVDAYGTPVAWGAKSVGGGPLAACPDGKVVTALDRVVGGGDEPLRLTIHRMSDLTVRHSIVLPLTAGERVQAMRCADPAGGLVELLVNHDEGLVPSRVMSVRRGHVVLSDVDEIRMGVATSDGFLAASGFHTSALTRIVDGVGKVLVPDTGMRQVGFMAVRPDDSAVAVWGYLRDADDPALRVFDLRSGMMLASRSMLGDVTGLTWSGKELVVRTAGAIRRPAPAMQVLDARLHPLGHLFTPTGSRLTTVGDTVLTYGGARVTLSEESGKTRTLPMVRLAAAEHLVGVPGRNFRIDDAPTK